MKYRRLKLGEIIKDGDEVDICNDGWRDEPKWIKAQDIGSEAPDPKYPSHRQYRRVEKIELIFFNSKNECEKQNGIRPDNIVYCGLFDLIPEIIIKEYNIPNLIKIEDYCFIHLL